MGLRCKQAKHDSHSMNDSDILQWNVAISKQMRSGKCNSALKVFNSMHRRSSVSYNAMISGYIMNDKFGLAKEMFDEMPERDLFSWNVMLGGYVRNRNLTAARDLFEKMPIKDVVSWNTMLSGYAQNGFVDEARCLFDKMPTVNAISWNGLLSAYVQNGRLDDARKLFESKKDWHTVSWNCLIGGFVKRKRLVDASACERQGYVQGGDITRARELFNEMPEHDFISWSAMIAGYVQNGFSEDALHLFVEMKRTGERLNRSSITCALTACSDIAALELEKRSARQCGSINEARDAFHEIAERDVVSWNTMIHGYARHGFGKEALSLFESMKTDDIRPDDVTMVGVLSACGHSGLVDKGTECFDSMTQEYGITPNPVHYTCMVDLLGRAGRLKEAHELLKNMPFKADAAAWGALLGASRVHGNIKLGESVADTVFSMEPNNSGMYILLSNLYEALEEEEKEHMLKYHSEKLAVAYGILSIPAGRLVRVMKNLR
ncbi:Pentatricopeptide repeat-containing protein At4g02750, partial [Linum grandiflorum]